MEKLTLCCKNVPATGPVGKHRMDLTIKNAKFSMLDLQTWNSADELKNRDPGHYKFR